MVVFPNCKINLGLRVLRRRADGFHDIETVMVPVPWRDILEIVPSKNSETSLTVSGNQVDCPPEKNLVMRAYDAMKSQVPDLPPSNIYLRKVIPDGAGLGGGSADAAFTLIALNDLYNLGKSKDELADMAASLGSDCPFFIYNRPMLCRGRGTEMEPLDLDLKGLSISIVKPERSVSTAQAYGRVRPENHEREIAEILSQPVTRWRGKLVNDFEASVFPILPECEEIKNDMYRHGAVYAAMSGSGSAVFGIFEANGDKRPEFGTKMARNLLL